MKSRIHGTIQGKLRPSSLQPAELADQGKPSAQPPPSPSSRHRPSLSQSLPLPLTASASTTLPISKLQPLHRSLPLPRRPISAKAPLSPTAIVRIPTVHETKRGDDQDDDDDEDDDDDDEEEDDDDCESPTTRSAAASPRIGESKKHHYEFRRAMSYNDSSGEEDEDSDEERDGQVSLRPSQMSRMAMRQKGTSSSTSRLLHSHQSPMQNGSCSMVSLPHSTCAAPNTSTATLTAIPTTATTTSRPRTSPAIGTKSINNHTTNSSISAGSVSITHSTIKRNHHKRTEDTSHGIGRDPAALNYPSLRVVMIKNANEKCSPLLQSFILHVYDLLLTLPYRDGHSAGVDVLRESVSRIATHDHMCHCNCYCHVHCTLHNSTNRRLKEVRALWSPELEKEMEKIQRGLITGISGTCLTPSNVTTSPSMYSSSSKSSPSLSPIRKASMISTRASMCSSDSQTQQGLTTNTTRDNLVEIYENREKQASMSALLATAMYELVKKVLHTSNMHEIEKTKEVLLEAYRNLCIRVRGNLLRRRIANNHRSTINNLLHQQSITNTDSNSNTYKHNYSYRLDEQNDTEIVIDDDQDLDTYECLCKLFNINYFSSESFAEIAKLKPERELGKHIISQEEQHLRDEHAKILQKQRNIKRLKEATKILAITAKMKEKSISGHDQGKSHR